MKKITIIITTIIIAAVSFSGCTKEFGESSDHEADKALVRLDFIGEVSIDESPITKAFSSGDLLGIQVKEGSDYYAYGLFDNPSNVSIYLHSGKKYSFECCLVKNGKSILTSVAAGTNTITYYPFSITVEQSKCATKRSDGGYCLPFVRGPRGWMYYLNYSSQSVSYWYDYITTPLSNSFVYTADTYFNRLSYGQLTVGNDYMYPKATIFYGKVDNVIGGSNLSIPIELKSGSFGVKLSVTGITDGDVTVTIKNGVQTFHTNSGITQDTEFGITKWSFYDLASAWQYANDYAENFTVSVVWNRGVGVTQDLGTKTVQFKRNAVNHVKINLGASTKSSNLAITLEDPEITCETYNVGN